MADTVFVLPGRTGDNILKLPICYQWAKQNNQKIDIILDDIWSWGMVPLLQWEPWVDQVECWSGIVSDACGGQPMDMGRLPEMWERWRTVHLLGYRSFPERPCLMTAALNQSGLDIDRTDLYTEPCLSYPRWIAPSDLAIHVDASH